MYIIAASFLFYFEATPISAQWLLLAVLGEQSGVPDMETRLNTCKEMASALWPL